jgi:hypothetical protein
MLRLGQRAVMLLLDEDGRPGEGRRETLGTTLMVRSSCGAQPRSTSASRPVWNRSRLVVSHRR